METAKKRADEQKAAGSGGGFELIRFWLVPNEKRRIVFLDGDDIDGQPQPITIWEHDLWVNGKHVFATCTRATPEGCVVCDRGFARYLGGIFTIIDTKVQYNGKTYINTKKLLVAKSATEFPREGREPKIYSATALSMLREKRAIRMETEGKGLTLAMYEVSRSGQKAVRIGDNYEFVRRVAVDELKDHEGKPLSMKPYGLPKDQWLAGYMKLLAPRSKEYLTNLLAQNTVKDGLGSWDDKKGGGGGRNQASPPPDNTPSGGGGGGTSAGPGEEVPW